MPCHQSLNGVKDYVIDRRRYDFDAVVTHKDTTTGKVDLWAEDGLPPIRLGATTYDDTTLHLALDGLSSFRILLATTAAMSTLSHITSVFPLMTARLHGI